VIDEIMLNNLYRYCYSLTNNEHNAYDLLQSALEKYLKSKSKTENSSAYIKKIIRNQYIDNYRREKRIEFESFEESTIPTDFDVKTLESIIVNEGLVEQIIEFLDMDEREILFFWAIEGMSASQIEIQIGVPRGTILSKIYRMRKKIMSHFDIETVGMMEKNS